MLIRVNSIKRLKSTFLTYLILYFNLLNFAQLSIFRKQICLFQTLILLAMYSVLLYFSYNLPMSL